MFGVWGGGRKVGGVAQGGGVWGRGCGSSVKAVGEVFDVNRRESGDGKGGTAFF